ncbi:MAG: hypothetical protein ACC707_09985 [Thiohalomonadales bacterium]
MKCFDSQVAQWYEVVVHDHSFLGGKFVAKFIIEVSSFIGANKLVFEDLSGANILEMMELGESRPHNIKDIIGVIDGVVQFDWCNFYLFSNNLIVPTQEQQYPEIIVNTIATIRAIDDAELYLYTKNRRLVNHIVNCYKNNSVIKNVLDAFVYPE